MFVFFWDFLEGSEEDGSIGIIGEDVACLGVDEVDDALHRGANKGYDIHWRLWGVEEVVGVILNFCCSTNQGAVGVR